MAAFHTHISTSSVIGVGYAAVSHFQFGIPLPNALVSGGMCALAGVLPDADSDSGKTVREIMGFAAAVVPLLLLPRLQSHGFSHELLILSGGTIYLFVRFGLGTILKRYTVHRGMWHSIPAAFIAGMLAALVCAGDQLEHRLLKVIGVVIGYLSHLVLDELYSIHWQRGRFRLKKSFGTALKFFGSSPWANISTYTKLVFVTVLVFGDSSVLLPETSDTRTREIVQPERRSDEIPHR